MKVQDLIDYDLSELETAEDVILAGDQIYTALLGLDASGAEQEAMELILQVYKTFPFLSTYLIAVGLRGLNMLISEVSGQFDIPETMVRNAYGEMFETMGQSRLEALRAMNGS